LKPTRCNTLRGDYTEEAIRERIAGVRVLSSAGKASTLETGSVKVITLDLEGSRRPSLFIDIQAKIQQGKGAGYERWAKIHNLKQMAQTLIYLQEQGLDDYDLLNEKASAASWVVVKVVTTATTKINKSEAPNIHPQVRRK